MTAWLDDEMALAERFALGFHLADCPGCRAYLAPFLSESRYYLGRAPYELRH